LFIFKSFFFLISIGLKSTCCTFFVILHQKSFLDFVKIEDMYTAMHWLGPKKIWTISSVWRKMGTYFWNTKCFVS
jgi:hypothetical protein